MDFLSNLHKKRRFIVLSAVLAALTGIGGAGAASVSDLPTIDGRKVVATVADEPITLDEFKRALAAAHGEAMTAPGRKPEVGQKAGHLDYAPIINRLVDIHLIVLESRNMGLDELPEIKMEVEKFARQTAIKLLLEKEVADVVPDESEIKRLYEDRVREYKLRSVLFHNKDSALKIDAEIKNGATFAAAAEEASADGLAEVNPEGEFMKAVDLSPSVARVVLGMKAGDVSPVVPVGSGKFVLFQLEAERIPEEIDRAAWEDARRKAMSDKRVQAARAYYEELRKRRATVDDKLLASIDYEADTPGFETFLADERVLADIKGEAPITVADLTRALEKQFFHGIRQAISARRVNAVKTEKLESMLQDRILYREARKKRLDRSDEYSLRVTEYKNALVFGTFIDKVITPDIQISRADLQAYYESHPDRFSSLRMIRLRSLIFRDKKDAEKALDQLAAGNDFSWMAANAEGQVDGAEKEMLRFDGRLLTESGLPSDLQKAVAGAKTGDFRLYKDENGGVYHVLYIAQALDSGPRPFEEVKEKVSEIVFKDKLKAAIDTWTQQLSRHYPVEIFLTSEE